MQSIGPLVAEKLCEIVKLRNKIARAQGYEDYYDFKARTAAFCRTFALSGSPFLLLSISSVIINFIIIAIINITSIINIIIIIIVIIIMILVIIFVIVGIGIICIADRK